MLTEKLTTKTFTPVSIKLTFETQQELDDFGAICNTTWISDTIRLPSYDFMKDLGANIHSTLAREKMKIHPAFPKVYKNIQ